MWDIIPTLIQILLDVEHFPNNNSRPISTVLNMCSYCANSQIKKMYITIKSWVKKVYFISKLIFYNIRFQLFMCWLHLLFSFIGEKIIINLLLLIIHFSVWCIF